MAEKVNTSELYTDFLDNLKDLATGDDSQDKVDQIIHIFNRYAKLKKVYGSLSYAKMVKRMRDAQNDFFRNRDSGASEEFLQKAKKLEEYVDQATEMIIKHNSRIS